jgi:hypothetical protein
VVGAFHPGLEFNVDYDRLVRWIVGSRARRTSFVAGVMPLVVAKKWKAQGFEYVWLRVATSMGVEVGRCLRV